MSLADLIPAITETRMERRKMTKLAIQLRYQRKHADRWNAYRRAWYARRKKA